LQPEALPIIFGVLLQHVLHVLGPPEEIEVERSSLAGRTPAADDVPVLAERFIE
jgi:hypothetical protein